MGGDELRAELWQRMPGAGLTDAEVKAVFAPATTPTREAPALRPGYTWKPMATSRSQAPSQRPETPSLPGWSVAWSVFRGGWLYVSQDGQVARETSPDAHMNPEEAAAAARSTSGDGQA